MKAVILSTGDEILTGAIVDSNAAYIAGKLVEAGIFVYRKYCVGDNLNELISVLLEIGTRSDIAIVTGGLGPTGDDLTAEAVAGAAKVPLIFSKEADRSIKAYFHSRNRPEHLADKKQAMLPDGSICLPNPVGTAPGFITKIGQCHVFCIPGVPSEMQYLMSHAVLPEMKKRFEHEKQVFLIKKMSLFGLPESVVGERLGELSSHFPEVKLGLRAHFPMIQIRLYAAGNQEARIHEQIEKAGAWVMERLGQWIFSEAGLSMEEEIGRLLTSKKATLGVAESCTGGLISHMLTNIPGSSAYFMFSGVTYSNQAKIQFLNVSRDSLDSFGAVSDQVVREMAKGVRDVSGTTYGLATSGIAGPDGGTPEKPTGTICIGIATPEKIYSKRLQLSFEDRIKNKTIFAMAALEMLRREITGNDIF
ncbi:MAG: competence/damage-inducible protein A [Desulfobacterium sp.]|nr:competence/damage-inducible protein A [Desulfobacterium sp.]